ncbi:MAG: M48 family metalloprotease [bacterium]
MTIASFFRPLLTFLWLAVIVGCETTDIAPLAAEDTPELVTDEAGLWQAFDKYEKDLQSSSLLETDPELNAYVRHIACNVTGPEYCDRLRLYIVNRPYFNATMAPNGMMEVWSGMLLRAENEAQLAFVLGHEFTHFRQRHSLQRWRSAKNLSNATLFLAIGGAAAGAPEAGNIGQLAAMAALYGYGRDQEREADDLGFEFATQANYAASEAAQLWEYLVEEVDHSDSKRKKRQFARASIFSTHPLTKERIQTLKAKADNLEQPHKRLGSEDYLSAVSPFWDKWLKEDLIRRDFGEHIYLINRLMKHHQQLGVLYFHRAEAYRLRRAQGDAALAVADYEQAAMYQDAPAQTWRYLGQAYKRAGRQAEAVSAYQTYLEKAPEAADRALVEQFLTEDKF